MHDAQQLIVDELRAAAASAQGAADRAREVAQLACPHRQVLEGAVEGARARVCVACGLLEVGWTYYLLDANRAVIAGAWSEVQALRRGPETGLAVYQRCGIEWRPNAVVRLAALFAYLRECDERREQTRATVEAEVRRRLAP